MSVYFSTFAWVGIFTFEFLFVLRGLIFKKMTLHYKNCLMLKIKYNFMILCLLFTSFFIAATFLNGKNS